MVNIISHSLAFPVLCLWIRGTSSFTESNSTNTEHCKNNLASTPVVSIPVGLTQVARDTWSTRESNALQVLSIIYFNIY